MNHHEFQLYAVPFTEADQERLAGFSCGAGTVGHYVTEWLLGSDVLESMKRGTRVWLFENGAGEIVGYGSVGPTKWKWPPPDGSRATIIYIPMLGIAEQFQGQPPDPEWKYSSQIMRHLINEARNLTADWTNDDPKRLKWLALLVQPENKPAVRLYERWGFELIPDAERAHGHVIMKLWIGE